MHFKSAMKGLQEEIFGSIEFNDKKYVALIQLSWKKLPTNSPMKIALRIGPRFGPELRKNDFLIQ